MQKLSQTEELARELASHARRHTVTPEQISRAMDEKDYDVAQLDELYAALETRGVHLAEEETELPALDETQIGRLEHELSAEGVALDDPVKTYLKEIGQVHSAVLQCRIQLVQLRHIVILFVHGTADLLRCQGMVACPRGQCSGQFLRLRQFLHGSCSFPLLLQPEGKAGDHSSTGTFPCFFSRIDWR